MTAEDVVLARIELKLDRVIEASGQTRERVARIEAWRDSHMLDHAQEISHYRWVIGLLVTTMATSLATAAVVLLH